MNDLEDHSRSSKIAHVFLGSVTNVCGVTANAFICYYTKQHISHRNHINANYTIIIVSMQYNVLIECHVIRLNYFYFSPHATRRF